MGVTAKDTEGKPVVIALSGASHNSKKAHIHCRMGTMICRTAQGANQVLTGIACIEIGAFEITVGKSRRTSLLHRSAIEQKYSCCRHPDAKPHPLIW